MLNQRTVDKPDRLPDQTARLLVLRIRGGEYAAGTRLPPEKTLADSLGVSRPVLREALLLLRHDGLVEARQGSGVYVSALPGTKTLRLGDEHSGGVALPSLEWLGHTYELRAYVEEAVAELAALRRNAANLSAMKHELDAMAKAVKTGQEAVVEDIHFHFAVAHASGNPAMVKLVEYIHGAVAQSVKVARGNSAMASGLSELAQREHEAIYNAIASGDPVAARHAARAHLVNASQRLGITPRVPVVKIPLTKKTLTKVKGMP